MSINGIDPSVSLSVLGQPPYAPGSLSLGINNPGLKPHGHLYYPFAAMLLTLRNKYYFMGKNIAKKYGKIP